MRMSRIPRILVITLVCTAVSVCVAGSNGEKKGHDKGKNGKARQGRSENGAYVVQIAGTFHGTGQAIVAEAAVSITAPVSNSDGTTGEFSAPGLTIDGPYFSGTGYIFGKPMTVRGRIDAARQSRVSATYYVDGHGGRFIAELPPGVDTPDDEWESHTRPSHRIKGNVIGNDDGSSGSGSQGGGLSSGMLQR